MALLPFAIGLGLGYVGRSWFDKNRERVRSLFLDATKPSTPSPAPETPLPGALPFIEISPALSAFSAGVAERIRLGEGGTLAPGELSQLQSDLGLPQTGDLDTATLAAVQGGAGVGCYGVSGFTMSGFGVGNGPRGLRRGELPSWDGRGRARPGVDYERALPRRAIPGWDGSSGGGSRPVVPQARVRTQ